MIEERAAATHALEKAPAYYVFLPSLTFQATQEKSFVTIPFVLAGNPRLRDHDSRSLQRWPSYCCTNVESKQWVYTINTENKFAHYF